MFAFEIYLIYSFVNYLHFRIRPDFPLPSNEVINSQSHSIYLFAHDLCIRMANNFDTLIGMSVFVIVIFIAFIMVYLVYFYPIICLLFGGNEENINLKELRQNTITVLQNTPRIDNLNEDDEAHSPTIQEKCILSLSPGKEKLQSPEKNKTEIYGQHTEENCDLSNPNRKGRFTMNPNQNNFPDFN